jgi:hypothetical protein
MDFKSALRPIRFSQRDLPAPFRVRSDRHSHAALKCVADLLAALPGPGETTHCFLAGRVDLADYLDGVLRKLGPAQTVRISTLSLAPRNLSVLKRWVDNGADARLTVLVSEFFVKHNRETFAALSEVLPPPHRAAASRTHAKLGLFHFQDGTKLTCHGSANLRCNANVEQLSVTADAATHDFFARFVDEYAEIDANDCQTTR